MAYIATGYIKLGDLAFHAGEPIPNAKNLRGFDKAILTGRIVNDSVEEVPPTHIDTSANANPVE